MWLFFMPKLHLKCVFAGWVICSLVCCPLILFLFYRANKRGLLFPAWIRPVSDENTTLIHVTSCTLRLNLADSPFGLSCQCTIKKVDTGAITRASRLVFRLQFPMAVCPSTCCRVGHRRYRTWHSPLSGMALFASPEATVPFRSLEPHLSLPVNCQKLILKPQLSFRLQGLFYKLCMGRRSHTFFNITEFY